MSNGTVIIDYAAFELTDTQICALEAYIQTHGKAHHVEDVGESFEYTVSFTFNVFGRSVSAKVISGYSELILEDALEPIDSPCIRQIDRPR
ncbi:hypothetical protein [Nevskia ramosa]|uniref:hypothetical protein n=1 Tax=Nevskia ramosa TaxID=64002 RepID=UPI003D0B87E8